MSDALSLIVTDASPLITLAAADALDCLKMVNVPIVIPDMVYFEVTRDLAKLGAVEMAAWFRRNRGRVSIAPTETFAEYASLIAHGEKVRSRGRGERAAQEVLQDLADENPDLNAILLYEDSDISHSRFVGRIPAGVTALSTGDLLQELEDAGRVTSRQDILDKALSRSRNVDDQRTPRSADDTRQVLREALVKGRG